MSARCAHPHCRTSLSDDERVECPHFLTFCEHCTWEEGCDQCSIAAQQGDAVSALAKLQGSVTQQGRPVIVPATTSSSAAIWTQPPYAASEGDVTFEPKNLSPNTCRGCQRTVHYGRPVARHYRAPGASSVGDAWHPECWRRFERSSS